MQTYLKALKTEYMENPLGLDCARPRFSWQLDGEEHNIYQYQYRLRVGSGPEMDDVWNSGVVSSSVSAGVAYGGPALAPCTRYYWQVTVWYTWGEGNRQNGVCTSDGKAWFETGFMDGSMEPWNGAQWIGPRYLTVSPDVKGIFELETAFYIGKDSTRAGIVLGANDRRLLDRENYFRFDVDVSTIPARLSIYRVGIDPKDCADTPIAAMDIVDYDSEAREPVITEVNKHDRHVINIQITGNCEYTSIDGKRIDVTTREMPWGGTQEAPRQINPLGNNDVNTFPRLNEIGFYVPQGHTADFEYIKLRHLRKPDAVFFEETAGKGMNVDCTGKAGSIFEAAFASGAMCVASAGSAASVLGAVAALDSRGPAVYRIAAKDCAVMVTGNPGHTSIPMLRRSFTLSDKPVASARLYATARGIYECRINGRAVTDTWLNPGQTQYDRHLMYQVYDVGSLLAPGENALGVILASGWWSDAQTFVLGNYNYYGDRESFLGKLVVTYEDGSREELVSDTAHWKYSPDGPWTYAGLFHGEHYNAVVGEAYEHFSEPGFDDSAWLTPDKILPTAIGEGEVEGNAFMHWPYVNQQEPKLIAQVGGGVYAIGEFEAQSVTQPREGVYIYDMGFNIAGVPKLHLHGKRGAQAVIRFAEMLCPDLPEFAGRVGTLMVENLRDADCTDLYTFRGDPEGEDYMPRFTFRGGRYIEVSGVTRPPKLSDVRIVQLSSLRELPGNVRVSNNLVNQFIDNVRRSQRANFISIPTDCPQRNERMGWDGDTSIFARTASFNSDVRLFYYRWLMAMRDLQENGKYPDIAPVGGGFGGFTYESAGLHVTWEVYQQYGDLRVIEDNYGAMTAFMDYSAANRAAGQLVTPGTLGDWLSPDPTDIELICLAFYGYNAYIMAKMAAAIGRWADSTRYEALYRELKQEFNERFFDHDTGKTKDDTQCSYALPLAFHMVDDALVERVGGNLARCTVAADHRVLTGFFGTAPLNPMLTATGHAETAFRLMEQTKCPSWLYPVTQGATSIWERWDSYTLENGFGGNNNMNSFNHYSLGAVCEWLYMYVLGIVRDEDCPGYRHFTVKPYTGSFKFVRGSFETPYGTIEAGWELDDGGQSAAADGCAAGTGAARTGNATEDGSGAAKPCDAAGNSCAAARSSAAAHGVYRLQVPANTSATVILPDGSRREVGSGSYEWRF